jgi:hypothetical protein
MNAKLLLLLLRPPVLDLCPLNCTRDYKKRNNNSVELRTRTLNSCFSQYVYVVVRRFFFLGVLVCVEGGRGYLQPLPPPVDQMRLAERDGRTRDQFGLSFFFCLDCLLL